MSTVVVVKKGGLAVIGADTMTKWGNVYQRSAFIANHSKILKLGENYLAYVGSAAYSVLLPSYFGRLKRIPPLDTPLAIFEAFRDLHKSLKDDYFLRPEEDEEDEFESSRIDVLIANPAGIFGLYAHRSVDEYTRFNAFGTGFQFALGAMRAIYETSAGAREIAQAGLEAAAEFDDATGAPFELYEIGLAGVSGARA
ncbi:MAG: hypothetical protein ACM3X6_04350 [Patescibacteria group bacterium]